MSNPKAGRGFTAPSNPGPLSSTQIATIPGRRLAEIRTCPAAPADPYRVLGQVDDRSAERDLVSPDDHLFRHDQAQPRGRLRRFALHRRDHGLQQSMDLDCFTGYGELAEQPLGEVHHVVELRVDAAQVPANQRTPVLLQGVFQQVPHRRQRLAHVVANFGDATACSSRGRHVVRGQAGQMIRQPVNDGLIAERLGGQPPSGPPRRGMARSHCAEGDPPTQAFRPDRVGWAQASARGFRVPGSSIGVGSDE